MRYTDILTGVTHSYNQKEFVWAYRYSYGGTIKHARQVYNDAKKRGDSEYIHLVYKTAFHDMLVAFYND